MNENKKRYAIVEVGGDGCPMWQFNGQTLDNCCFLGGNAYCDICTEGHTLDEMIYLGGNRMNQEIYMGCEGGPCAYDCMREGLIALLPKEPNDDRKN